MTTPTFDQITEAAKAVIIERGPEFVYSTGKVDENGDVLCVYSEDGGLTGSCLFGKALIEKLGVEYRSEWENKGINTVLAQIGRADLTFEQEMALDAVQGSQDEARPYEEVGLLLDKRLARLVD